MGTLRLEQTVGLLCACGCMQCMCLDTRTHFSSGEIDCELPILTADFTQHWFYEVAFKSWAPPMLPWMIQWVLYTWS
jgi:hypothetical protein